MSSSSKPRKSKSKKSSSSKRSGGGGGGGLGANLSPVAESHRESDDYNSPYNGDDARRQYNYQHFIADQQQRQSYPQHIIDDDEDVLLAAKLLLKKHAHQVIIEKNPKKIPFLLNNGSYDVILLDMNFSKDITSGKEGFYWLQQIIDPDNLDIIGKVFNRGTKYHAANPAEAVNPERQS